MTEPVDTPLESVRPNASRRAVRLLPAITAAAIVALAATTVIIVTQSRSEGDAGTATTGTPIPGAATDSPALAGFVVHDGDQVEASGVIEARPGQPVRFCSPAPVPAGGAGQTLEPCDGLPVTGVDLSKLSEPWMTGDIQQGRTRLRGTWRSGTFTVTQQLPYVPSPQPGFVDRPVPCEAPPGGWQLHETGRDDLRDYIYNTHPDQFKEPWAAHPYPFPADGRTENWNSTSVMVIEVVKGDVDEARRELERRYPGNLCVISSPGQVSVADQGKVMEVMERQVSPLLSDRANGVYFVSLDGATIDVGMKMLTPQLYEKLKDIPNLRPQPWFAPAH